MVFNPSRYCVCPWFISKVWKAFCQALGATISLSSGFHPKPNGQTEPANKDLKVALRCVTATNLGPWSPHFS